MTSVRIAIGSDEAGDQLKAIILAHVRQVSDSRITDVRLRGAQDVDYPDIGFKVAKAVATGRFDRAILICGTGIGMSIVANKVAGVRAALCHDVYSAERARMSNDAQVITMGARVIGPEHAKRIIDAWLGAEFTGGASARKVGKISAFEREAAQQP